VRHRTGRRPRVIGSAFVSLVMIPAMLAMPAFAAAPTDPRAVATRTPIKHLIVIVGENRSFDHLFATYQPPARGQSVFYLLSAGIIKSDGSPGPNFSKAQQWQADDTEVYSIAPKRTRSFATLPQPNSAGARGLPPGPDARFPADLADGPFQLSRYTPYQLSFTGDPVHRFFQMWQQYDQGRGDLFPWVGVTIGTGSNGQPPPSHFDHEGTHQGGVAMGFYNMSQGDAPVFKFIADNYALSDNYHQGIMGGTGADFIYLGTGDVAFYGDGSGNPLRPPNNKIENPNPRAGTNNWYSNDGFQGGSYVNCADDKQPGVAPVLGYLKSIKVPSRCAPEHFYLVNNYGPSYNADGTPVDLKQNPFTLPPQTIPNIGEALSKAGLSWRYYIGDFGAGSLTCGARFVTRFSSARVS